MKADHDSPERLAIRSGAEALKGDSSGGAGGVDDAQSLAP